MNIKLSLVLLAFFVCVCCSQENGSREMEMEADPFKVKPREGFRLKKKRRMAITGDAPALRVKRSAASTPPPKGSEEEDKDFEVVTEADKRAAQQAVLKDLLRYAAYTLGAGGTIILIVACFVMDPRVCLLAFGSGSPCCLLCPCYRHLMQYTDPAKLIKANVNLYVPGIYIESNGTMRQYPPSPDEMDCMFDLLGEFVTPT